MNILLLLTLLTLYEFDIEYEFSGNLADEIIRTKTFHCQKTDLPSTPNCSTLCRNLQKKEGTFRYSIRFSPDS